MVSTSCWIFVFFALLLVNLQIKSVFAICHGKGQLFDDMCYKIDDVPEDWNSAQDNCNKLGMNLTSIHTEAENSYILGLLNESSRNCAWIGMRISKNNVLWSDNSSVTYKNWDCKEDSTITTCGLMCKGQKWVCSLCTLKNLYVCKGQQDCKEYLIPYSYNWDVTQVPSVRFGEQFEVLCKHGYESEYTDISCLEKGSWTEIPKCSKVECQQLDIPDSFNLENASIPRHKYMDNVILSCKYGYETNESLNIMCQGNGSWSDLQKCTAVKCEDIHIKDKNNLENTQVLNKTFMENVTLTCKLGYKFSGSLNITCQGDRSWSKLPQCSEVECPQITIPDDSFLIPKPVTIHKYGDCIPLTCKDGYSAKESLTIKCQANGTWTEIPRCSEFAEWSPISIVTVIILGSCVVFSFAWITYLRRHWISAKCSSSICAHSSK